MVSVRRHIRVPPPQLIKPAYPSARVRIIPPSALIPLKRQIRLRKEPINSFFLPLRRLVNIREPTSTPEPIRSFLSIYSWGSIRLQDRRSHSQDIRTRRQELGIKHIPIRPQTPRRRGRRRKTAHPIIARRNDNRRSLQPQLHDLRALPLLIRFREVDFGAAVRDADYVCGLVDAAHELARVPAPVVRVGVLRVPALGPHAVAAFAVGFEGAVAAVDGVPEVWRVFSREYQSKK